MSEKIVNALAEMKRVYIEEVSHNNLLQQRIDEEFVQIQEYKKPRLDPVGQEDDDIDNDGDSDETDSYLSNRRKVRSKAINKEDEEEEDEEEEEEEEEDEEEEENSTKKKKKSVKESRYYSWRDTIDENTLWEIVDSEEQKQIKEKNVNNYNGKNPVVTINPEVKTESFLLDVEELDEDFIQESINIVSDYLCEEGLTLDEIQNLIDEIGVEEFSEWVLEFGYNIICEEAVQGELLTSKGKARKSPKITSQTGSASVIKHTPSKSSSDSETERSPSPGQLSINFSNKKTNLPPGQQRIIDNLKSAKKRKEVADRLKDTVARGVLSALKGHSKAMDIKKSGGTIAQQLGGGAGAALGSFFSRGNSQFREWVEDLLQEGYDLSEYTWDELYEEYEELYEKAVSEQQQKLFGLALSVKRGETSRNKVSKEVLKIVDTMSEKQIRKYAKTSHGGIPEKKEELAEKVIEFVRENY